MELMLDTCNLEAIKYYIDYYPICGVTSNPSILKKEGHVDFFKHMKAVFDTISSRELMIQVVGENSATMINEARHILNKIDRDVFIKVPVNEQGLKAISTLKHSNIKVTATAIYTKMQGFLAIMVGADYIAPYCKRMQNNGIDYMETISAYRNMIDKYNYKTKILAASFADINQVTNAYVAGAHGATISPDLMASSLDLPFVKDAVDNFNNDFKSLYGNVSITEL